MRIAMILHNDMLSDARVDHEAAALVAAGHDLCVFALQAAGVPEHELRAGFEIRRVAARSRASWSRPLRKFAELRKRRAAMLAALASFGPEVVHCHDLDTLSTGFAARAELGCLVVYDAHELFTEMTGFAERPYLARRYWKRLEASLVPEVSLAITVNHARAAELEQRYGTHFEVIENAPEFEPLSNSNRLRTELGLADSAIVALYQGGLAPGRALERLAQAATRVDGLTLVFQGFGPLEEHLRAVANDSGGSVRFLGKARPTELHEYASAADIGIVIYENTGLNNYLAAPNKMYSYMMAGLPVATSDFPGLADVVVGERVGEVFDPADVDSIEATLRALASSEQRRTEMGLRARALAEDKYNWPIQAAHLVELYAKLNM